MKSINLLSLAQASDFLNESAYHSFIDYYGIGINSNEVNDLKVLIGEMNHLLQDFDLVKILNDFYVGYKIPHISKEFDLLCFGVNHIINVEIKRESNEDKIKKQLIENQCYLSHIGKTIYNFCFVANTKTLYQLNDSGELLVVNIRDLVQCLTSDNLLNLDSPDSLFNPSEYLVSPFNSTSKFINNQYFLTGHQNDVKKSILENMESYRSSFISITGGPGTGKTLLTYDIVKSVSSRLRTLIVHCAQLNQGHSTLSQNGWNIVAIKNFMGYDLSSIDLVVFDEAQRLNEVQLAKLIDYKNSNNIHCVFSYDKKQTLHSSESQMNLENKLKDIVSLKQYNLSGKIRINKEIANFIKILFNNKRNDITISNSENIDFEYFTNSSHVKSYLDIVADKGWQVLKLTPSQYEDEYHKSYSLDSSQNSHQVIGQEFDNVAVVIDQYYSYNKNGDLIYNLKTYYDSVNMLFQNITRTRKNLKLIIIDNQQVLDRCLSVLK